MCWITQVHWTSLYVLLECFVLQSKVSTNWNDRREYPFGYLLVPRQLATLITIRTEGECKCDQI